MLKKTLNLFFYFLLIYFYAISATVGPAIAEEYGGTIVESSIADARTLVPILASDTQSAQICGLIFNGLLKYDKDINLTGDLAESWEIKENGLVIIFRLKKGVLWHDGEEFSAKDVKFTYEKLVDPKVRTPYSGDFQKVKDLKILDRYTVWIRYDEPFAPGLSSWCMWIMPEHILRNEDLNTSNFARHPVGTGPYKLRKWLNQETIELVRNDDYFEGKPYISRCVYKIIPDPASIFLELQSQDIDSASLTPLQYSRQTENRFFKSNFNKFNLPNFGYTYLGYNLKDIKFKDKRIRQALNYAINKQDIINIVLLGLGEISTGPFVPQSWAYNPQVKPVEFNQTKALKLLKEAGWIDRDNDGFLDKDLKIFEFTIITNQGNEQRLKTAQIIQKQLKEIGIRVKIKVIEWSALLSEFIDKGRFEAILLGWSTGLDPDCYDIWHSSKTKPGEFNFINYNNPEVDSLLETARITFDIEKRKTSYKRIQELIYEDQPYMFLYVADSLQIINSRIKGIKPAPLGLGYNFIKWWIPKKLQKYRNFIN